MGWQIVESVECVVAMVFRGCMARQAESLGLAGTPVILGRWRSARSVGIQSTELKALEGFERHSLVACEAHLNPPRKPGCCLLSLEPVWEVQAICNWVVCYTVINTQRILIHNTCSLCFAKLFLNHSAFLSSQQPCKAGRANILPLLYKWDN